MTEAPKHPPLPASPKRRRLLIAGAGVVIAGATGAVWLDSKLAGKHAWIEAVVRRHLPGVKLDTESLATFVAQFAAGRELQGRTANAVMVLDQALPGAAQRMAKAARRLERLERRIVTEYLLGSNFFRVRDPRQEAIVYSGALPACGNPFAQFRG